MSTNPDRVGAPAPRVVVVDDDPLVLAVTRRLLTRAGYDVICCDHPRAALREVIRCGAFAVVADLHMPDLGGGELLRLIGNVAPQTWRILFTGESYLSELSHVISPLVADAVVTKAGGSLELPRALEELRALESARRGAGDVRGLAMSLVSAFAATRLEGLDHALRLARGTLKLGLLAGLGEEQLKALELGALLHDVGMSCVPEVLLRQSGGYGEEERQLMRQHPVLGAELLRDTEALTCALPVVLYHHERYDGSGYPSQLAGEQIPLAARLFSVVDTYEALTRERPHAVSRSEPEARCEIERVSGSQLDPWAVELFLGVDPSDWKRPSIAPSALSGP